ncbi:excisionase family DNA-binding protein [Mycolicibacterium wolinskyi]|uniref:excisionase family DNA-binding protein n=1 Tax=Mycolicibacterium wolinskyi TaxID=59750 RepID=UPI0008351732|nr:excisionase family DNA-binding protein [Mycolicibacterium wolinskyi]
MARLSLGVPVSEGKFLVLKNPTPTPVQRKLCTVGDVCGQLSVGRTTVYGLIADGTLRRVKVGARALIPQSDVDAFVAGLLDGGNA